MTTTKTSRGHGSAWVSASGSSWTVRFDQGALRGSRNLFSRMLIADSEELVRLTETGIPAKMIVYMATVFAKRPAQFAPLIGLSRSTLDRKLKINDRLDFIGADRTIRFARLWKQALDVWENEAATREWLDTPNQHLSGATPFDRAATEVGCRQVEDLLGQIAHGVLP